VTADKSSAAQVDAKLSELPWTGAGRSNGREAECARTPFEMVFEIIMSVTGITATRTRLVWMFVSTYADWWPCSNGKSPSAETEGRDMKSSKSSFCRRSG